MSAPTGFHIYKALLHTHDTDKLMNKDLHYDNTSGAKVYLWNDSETNQKL